MSNDPRQGPLRGVRVIVAGAGLSGLVTARALAHRGASVRIIEARDRVGGRVWTYREPPIAPFHVELGGEFIDKGHKALRRLCHDLNIDLVRVLRRGFGLAIEQRGRVRVIYRQTDLWKSLTKTLKPAATAFKAADRDWASTAAAAIGRRSLREVLDAADVEPHVHDLVTALRGFFLAEPEDLSALAAVEQTADGDDPSCVPMYRIKRGGDRLIEALQKDAGCRVDLNHAVRAVEQDGRAVDVTIEGPNGRRSRAKADYLVATVPAPLLRAWTFSPALPDPQVRALESLTYGRATKVVLRFSTRWWRQSGRPRAFSGNLPIGAVWESAEEQSKAAFLTLLAGGAASAQLCELLEREGAPGITRRLRWLGRGQREMPQMHAVTWEKDPWSQGGYAYFSPAFDPGLRDLLARGAGRVLFAGDHTSREFQGSMNGAVESGLRAAEDLSSLERVRKLIA